MLNQEKCLKFKSDGFYDVIWISLKDVYCLLPFSVSSVVNTSECLLWEGKIIDNGPLFQRRAG